MTSTCRQCSKPCNKTHCVAKEKKNPKINFIVYTQFLAARSGIKLRVFKQKSHQISTGGAEKKKKAKKKHDAHRNREREKKKQKTTT